MSGFQLHPRLAQDCVVLGCFELCQVLLMNDSQYPWCILVPQVPDVREIYQLNSAQQTTLATESSFLAQHLAALFQADKMNIAAIGNLVPQLHIHHVVRYQTDPVWPAPIWGKLPAMPYSEGEMAARVLQIRERLGI